VLAFPVSVESKISRILVVDDEPEWREGVKDCLEDSGYSVAVASDGPAALELVEQFRPAVVVTDFQMPVMDGAEFLGRVHTVDETVPVIVLTGDANTIRGTGLPGAFRVIAKTSSAEAMLTAIADATRARGSRLSRPHKVFGLCSRLLQRSRRALVSSVASVPRSLLLTLAVVSSFAFIRHLRMTAG
jgi:CheY-like chemotaxis protein